VFGRSLLSCASPAPPWAPVFASWAPAAALGGARLSRASLALACSPGPPAWASLLGSGDRV
jgi:hypothetical protein